MKTRVIDAHVHIFPPAMVERRDLLLAADAWFQETFGHPAAKMRTVEELIARMDAAGVDVSVVVGWPWALNELCVEHNTYLADAGRQFPDRIVWLGIINPVDQDSLAEIERCIELGAKGFGEINADGQGFSWRNEAQIGPALEAIAAARVPLMCHASEPLGHTYPGKGTAYPSELLAAIEAHPNLRWVLAHWGGGMPFYELMPEVSSACELVAYDSAATSYLYNTSIFRRVIDTVGVEKVMFGSDWPVLSQAKLIDKIRSAGLTDSELQAVMGGNAARLYQLG